MKNQELNTHLKYNQKFGRLVEITETGAKVILETTQDMAVDDEGLIHGGFTFSAADFCAMASVNEPYVVLVKATGCEFMAPIKVGESVEFTGKILMKEKRKVEVEVIGMLNDIKVFKGIFSCIVLDTHIFKKVRQKK